MKKTTCILLIALLIINVSIPLMGVISVASAADSLLFTLDVPSDGSKASSTIALQNGANYKIVVLGYYYTGTPIQSNQQDAMYASHDQWATHLATQSGLYIDSWSVGSKQWGDYSSSHTYQCYLTGNGSAVNFWIYSPSYSGNSGHLTVEILGSPVAPSSSSPTPSTSSSASTSPTSPTQTTGANSPTTSPSNSPGTSPTAQTSPKATSTTTQITGAPSGYGVIIAIALVAVIAIAAVLAVVLSKRKKP